MQPGLGTLGDLRNPTLGKPGIFQSNLLSDSPDVVTTSNWATISWTGHMYVASTIRPDPRLFQIGIPLRSIGM